MCSSWLQYIAKKLLEINERGKYVPPATLHSDNPADKEKLLAQEEELFQIARLVNCGWFASGKSCDYVHTGRSLLTSRSRFFGLLLLYPGSSEIRKQLELGPIPSTHVNTDRAVIS